MTKKLQPTTSAYLANSPLRAALLVFSVTFLFGIWVVGYNPQTLLNSIVLGLTAVFICKRSSLLLYSVFSWLIPIALCLFLDHQNPVRFLYLGNVLAFMFIVLEFIKVHWLVKSGFAVCVSSLGALKMGVEHAYLLAIINTATISLYSIRYSANLNWNPNSLGAALAEWLIISLSVRLYLDFPNPFVFLFSVFIIGCRLHGLFILYHDAVHNLWAKERRINDFLVNILVGVPTFLPVHVYRPLHLNHHQNVGTLSDPERLLLYAGQPWNYAPLPLKQLFSQFLQDLFLIGMLKSLRQLMLEKKNCESNLKLRKDTFHIESWVAVALWLGILVFGYYWLATKTLFYSITLYGTGYLTIMPFLEKLRSFTEHSISEEKGITHSWNAGLWARSTIWPYHINYHKDHHHNPTIPWHDLPCRFSHDGFKDSKIFLSKILELPALKHGTTKQ